MSVRRRALARTLGAAGLALAAALPLLAGGAASARAQTAQTDAGAVPLPTGEPLRIVAPYAAEGDGDTFVSGLRLAVREVNEAGGILGRPVALVPIREGAPSDFESTAEEVDRALRLADAIVSDDRPLAVIGHSTSSTALPASTVYQLRDVLFLATHATDRSLSNLGFDRVFLMTPNNGDHAAAMARYALAQGYKRFVVLSDRSEFGRELSNQFRAYVTVSGGDILHTSLIDGNARSSAKLLLFLLDNALFGSPDIDAVFLSSAGTQPIVEFVSRARALGLTQPIIGPQNLFSSSLEEAVGKAAMKDVTAVSIYDAQSDHPEAVAFRESYMAETGVPPDQRAAIGYDSVKLLADAASQVGVVTARGLSEHLLTMRYIRKFVGATGPIAFDAKGRVTDTQIFINRHDGTHFETVQSYTLPLDFETPNDSDADPSELEDTPEMTEGADADG